MASRLSARIQRLVAERKLIRARITKEMMLKRRLRGRRMTVSSEE